MTAHRLLSSFASRLLPSLALTLLAAQALNSRIQAPLPARQPDKAERIGIPLGATAIVDVLVHDRQGHFADNLTRDQIELLVDDKPQQPTFFEPVTAGSPEEETLWQRARDRQSPSPLLAAAGGSGRGRSLLFFVDDLHMPADSAARVRRGLTRYIDRIMGPDDRVAIVTASNRIGFLRQLTGDKSELRAAVEQLTSRQTPVAHEGPPPMTEAQAIAIEKDDPAVLAQFMQLTLPKSPASGKAARQGTEKLVRGRASALAGRSAKITEIMLYTLVDGLRSYAASPGRKLAFFLSDGFFMRDRLSEGISLLMQATDVANRGRIAVYTINPRSLDPPERDDGAPLAAVATGRPGASASGQTPLPQDGLAVLAIDTGGRFLRNAGALDEATANVLAETSRYYLLGWRIDPTILRLGNSKSLKASIKGRPDLTVHLRQNSIDLARFIAPEPDLIKDATGEALMAALRSPTGATALPVSLFAGYLYRTEKGPILIVSLQATIELEEGGQEMSLQPSAVGIMGVVFDKSGTAVDFFRNSLPASKNAMPGQKVEMPLARAITLNPGLYQIRVAAHAVRSGRTGSTAEWIDVPAFTAGKLALSSVFIAEEQSDKARPENMVSTPILDLPLSVKRRFTPSMRLNYLFHIYNPVYPSDGSLPRVSVQTKIYRGEDVVTRGDMHPIPIKAGPDKGPLSYAAQFALGALTPGTYILEVIARDDLSGESAQQRASFWIQ